MTTPPTDEQPCAVMGCRHPRKSHSWEGKCTEVNTYYGMVLYGLRQGGIRKVCDCTEWSELPAARRLVKDGPQA